MYTDLIMGLLYALENEKTADIFIYLKKRLPRSNIFPIFVSQLTSVLRVSLSAFECVRVCLF